METYFSPTALELRKKGMGALLLEKMRDVLLHILRYLGGIGRYESIQMFNDVSRLYNDISDVLADYAANREAEEEGTQDISDEKSTAKWFLINDKDIQSLKSFCNRLNLPKNSPDAMKKTPKTDNCLPIAVAKKWC